MNNTGAGFMNAVYILKKVLQDADKTSEYVAMMKWYTNFGEVYQSPFEYVSTTADRMRTISLWRLESSVSLQFIFFTIILADRYQINYIKI